MRGMVSQVYRENGIIKKQYIDFKKYAARNVQAHWNCEIEALGRLGGKKHFPQVLSIDHNKHTIYMTDCGEGLTCENLPDDWKKQCKEIEQTFNEAKVFHLDFWDNNRKTHKNICVKNGIINIIDFGLWADKQRGDNISDIISTIANNR